MENWRTFVVKYGLSKEIYSPNVCLDEDLIKFTDSEDKY